MTDGDTRHVPKLNLGLLRRAAESIPAHSPVSVSVKTDKRDQTRRSSKRGELSASHSSSVDSGNDFSSQAEHMDDEELKFILRKQYKKVCAVLSPSLCQSLHL